MGDLVGLTGSWFIGTLFLLVLALGTVTVARWPRLGGRGVRPVLARTGLLAAVQAAALLAVLTAVNAHFEFYAGWDDLFGTNAAPGRIQRAEARAGHVPAVAALSIHRLAPPGGAGRDPRKAGALEELRFTGASTGLPADGYVLLPPEYFQPAYAARRFPVVVALTGYPGHPSALLRVMHLPDLVRQGERSGRVPPAVYVMMRPTLAPPRDTECTDVPGGPQVASFFGEDVPLAVQAHYRVATDRAGWGIMGDSTGGYCAAKVAMTHPASYTAAASLSGYFTTIKDMTTGDLYGGSRGLRDENDLLWRERHLPPPPVSLLVASCRIGEQTFAQSQRFVAGARPPMRTDSLFLESGGHNFRTFRRMVPATLEWFGGILKAQ
ncbi:alpha/beta hydrolase [Actinomadura parmotrematis]|uniref:Prolyl oligopeptidase family serine peptidase n=1 Tax=Actinomadura parmotrematis TaxID=2864039 RepID=A0ABS7FU86_9ACTN|nr:alpha/beta hydrolase-fold protein [Actinomadura parmotrematis]MBW8483963.1 prolyl oligopeptidase family serine peptidase [Actinomadura parmotrematis]